MSPEVKVISLTPLPSPMSDDPMSDDLQYASVEIHCQCASSGKIIKTQA